MFPDFLFTNICLTWEKLVDGFPTLPLNICECVKTNSPPEPATTVVFASLCFDAAISVRGNRAALRCFPLIGLERLADCCVQTVRKGK